MLTSSDVGRRLRIRVTATNSSGSTTATSNPTATVKASPTVGQAGEHRRARDRRGRPRSAQTLTTSPGSWTGQTPITYSATGGRAAAPTAASPDGSNCSTIGGATSRATRSRAVGARQAHPREVTARNTVGSDDAASDPTVVVAPAGPPGDDHAPERRAVDPRLERARRSAARRRHGRASPRTPCSRAPRRSSCASGRRTRAGYVVRDARVFISSTPLVTTGRQRTSSRRRTAGCRSRSSPRSSFPQIRSGTTSSSTSRRTARRSDARRGRGHAARPGRARRVRTGSGRASTTLAPTHAPRRTSRRRTGPTLPPRGSVTPRVYR